MSNVTGRKAKGFSVQAHERNAYRVMYYEKDKAKPTYVYFKEGTKEENKAKADAFGKSLLARGEILVPASMIAVSVNESGRTVESMRKQYLEILKEIETGDSWNDCLIATKRLVVHYLIDGEITPHHFVQQITSLANAAAKHIEHEKVRDKINELEQKVSEILGIRKT